MWSRFDCRSAPFVLAEDRGILEVAVRKGWAVSHSTWEDVISAPEFAVPGDTRLHLGLFPGPFVGDLLNASVYLLMLNPGLSPLDYFGESRIPEFREALLRNFRQQHHDEYAFMFLDPRYSWTGGFDWWHGKLARVIEDLRLHWKVGFAEARRRLAKQVACIEMVPYHSASFRDRGDWVDSLPSAMAAREFVKSYVMDKVRAKKAIVIATRQVYAWALPEEDGVIMYSGGETRGAHLTPDSRGGRAIVEHLKANR